MPSNETTERSAATGRSLPNAGPVNHMHDVLSDPYRRLILHRLDAQSGPVEIGELGEEIRDMDPSTFVDASKQDVSFWLVHEHLLPLEEFGLVAYHRETDAVCLVEQVVISVVDPTSVRTIGRAEDSADCTEFPRRPSVNHEMD